MGRGGEDRGSPLKGNMMLPRTPTILCKPRLGCWTPDTKLCLTTGPDPAGPGDRPLPSAGETTDLPTSDPHLLPTASAGSQSCPHLDTSWQGDSGAPARTELRLTVRAPSRLALPPRLLSEKLLPRPQVLQNQNRVAIRMATLPESSFPLLPGACHLETNIRSLPHPLLPEKVLSPYPNSASPPPPPARTL